MVMKNLKTSRQGNRFFYTDMGTAYTSSTHEGKIYKIDPNGNYIEVRKLNILQRVWDDLKMAYENRKRNKGKIKKV